MSLEKLAAKAVDINVKGPYQRISTAVGAEKLSGKGSTLLGELLKEGATLPLRNIAAITNWTGKKMLGVLGGTMKLGLQAASLIPLPLPGGLRNAAEAKGMVKAYREALSIKASGNTESFQVIADRIRGIRNAAETSALAS